MKQIFTTLIWGLFISASSCSNGDRDTLNKKSTDQKIENFDTRPENILKDYKTWYSYTYYNIRLAQDFIGLDSNSKSLNKTQFLNNLATGKFLAIKTTVKDNLPTYKLYKLNNTDVDITSTMMQLASHELSNYQMEGKEIPDFNFTDLNGTTYNKATTKGKILILKCWFIHCVACVREFPELNKLVDEYRQDNNIKFVSLASDNKENLISFLKDRQFKYAVVPNSDSYMTQSLGIQEYPTHIFVDPDGKIQKVVNSVDDLIAFLQKVRTQAASK
jgi:peroxiredoxin